MSSVAKLAGKVNASPTCNLCAGTGWQDFYGTKILCCSCNSESNIVAYWNSVDALLKRKR